MAPTVDRSLEAVITEQEFLALLQKRSRPFFLLGNYLRGVGNGTWSRHMFSHVSLEADELESFLDDFGARNNGTYSTFAELVASIRNFGRVGQAVSHVLGRLPRYDVDLASEDERAFVQRSKETLQFCADAIRKLLDQLYQESRSLGLELPTERIVEENLRDRELRFHLPDDADEGGIREEGRRAAEFTSRLIQAVDLFDRLGIRPIADYEGLRRFVDAQCDEEKARKYESIVHSLQSKYDTFVKGSVTETQHPTLKTLRGEISVALHLLEATMDLVHFYERHENDIRNDETRTLVAALVDKKRVLDRVVNFGLLEALGFLRRAKKRAQDLLPSFLSMTELVVQLPPGVRLHARPASLIVGIVNRYGTPVTMELNGQEANARSIMQVLMLAGSTTGAEAIRFRGDERPLHDLKLLFLHRLGEGGIQQLPHELHYLQEAAEPR